MIYPTFEEFTALAKQGNLIPVYSEILADTETPVSTFLKLSRSPRRKKGVGFLLESVEGGERIGRYSFLGGEPMLLFRSRAKLGTIERPGQKKKENADGDPLDVLRQLLSGFRYVATPQLPRFAGGAVGYLSYDAVQYFEPLKLRRPDDLHLPEALFVFSDTLVVFDHLKHTLKIVAHAHIQNGKNLRRVYDEAVKKVAAMRKKLTLPLRTPPQEWTSAAPDVPFKSNFTQEKFEAGVRRAKRYIEAGDVIQVVLSQRFSTGYTGDPFLLYRALRGINPSPYMFYLEFPEGAFVGSSPEMMVRCEEGAVEIRPIAGTRPRGKTEVEDAALGQELLGDPKERSEHIMLVDLARNDIGRVCEISSVTVEELMMLERYSHVMHIVSSVTGKLNHGKDAFDLLRATFPAGTVTGAPKVRAMQIIEEIENRSRGPYAGTVCYFSFSGNLDSAITIRTLFVKDKKVWIQAGAGIVADSDPAREYEETLNKARALLKAVSLVKGQ